MWSLCLTCDFIIISNCAEHYMNSNFVCVCVYIRDSIQMRACAQNSLINFLAHTYVIRPLIKIQPRSCENPLTDTDGEISSFCTLRIQSQHSLAPLFTHSHFSCMINALRFSDAGNKLRFWTIINHPHFASSPMPLQNLVLSPQEQKQDATVYNLQQKVI